MAQLIRIEALDGHVLDAWWQEVPAADLRGGIVILHAIYGLTDHIGDVCDQFARDGYAAVAPALYDRTQRGTVFGYDAAGLSSGMAFREHLVLPTVMADLGGCAAYLRERVSGVAVAGFCTGGTWAWIGASVAGVDAAVIFYGSDVFAEIDRIPKCPTVLHYGDQDPIVPIDQVTAIRAAHPDTEFHIYPGCGHAFFNPEQTSHDAEAAVLCHQRSIDFLRRHL